MATHQVYSQRYFLTEKPKPAFGSKLRHKRPKKRRMVLAHALNPWQTMSLNLVYKAHCRTARPIQRNPVSVVGVGGDMMTKKNFVPKSLR